MIRTGNAGILEAIEAVRTMNLIRSLRYMYEEHLKAKRDRWAEDEYVRDLGKAEGKIEGRAEGKAEGRVEGKAEYLLRILEEFGGVPDGLRERVCSETDSGTLDAWFLAARKATGLQEFYELTEIEITSPPLTDNATQR